VFLEAEPEKGVRLNLRYTGAFIQDEFKEKVNVTYEIGGSAVMLYCAY
jgi:hypothetical protein